MFNYYGFIILNVNICIFIYVFYCLFKKKKIQIEGIRLELIVKLFYIVIFKFIKFILFIISDNKLFVFY